MERPHPDDAAARPTPKGWVRRSDLPGIEGALGVMDRAFDDYLNEIEHALRTHNGQPMEERVREGIAAGLEIIERALGSIALTSDQAQEYGEFHGLVPPLPERRKYRRAEDLPGIAGVHGKFGRIVDDYLTWVEQALQREDRPLSAEEIEKARLAALMQIERALELYRFDSAEAMAFLGRRWRPPWWWASLVALAGIGVLALALWVIVGNFPRAWEGPTLIYFTREDGLTLSDLVASVGCVLGEIGVLWAWRRLSTQQ